jgi:exoribonuclease R
MSRKKQVPIKRKVRSAVDEPRYTGSLEITRGGMGFVIVPGLSKDIIIRPEQLRTGLNGDTVQVEIIKKSTNGRMEGRIASVIARKQNEFARHAVRGTDVVCLRGPNSATHEALRVVRGAGFVGLC